MIQELKSLGYYIESYSREINNISSEFEFPIYSVILFDLKGDFEMNLYYEKNYDAIVEKFKDTGYKFIFLPSIDYPDYADKIIEYYLPHLTNKLDFSSNLLNHLIMKSEQDDRKYFSFHKNDNKDVLNFLNYNGKIQSGFIIYYGSSVFIIEYTNDDIKKGLESPLNHIIDLIKYDSSVISSSRRQINSKEFESSLEDNLDEETIAKINHIKEQVEELKTTGKILYILPMLKNILNQYSNEINLDYVSTIKINNDNAIILPYFNNMEVPLSYLTKVIYILFTRYPKGIDIRELYKYENEILDLYLAISNQENYDKMKQSVSDLISQNSKAIYTHISRIKSTFYKIMDKHYAKNYIITSSEHGSTHKFIPLLKPKQNINEDMESWY